VHAPPLDEAPQGQSSRPTWPLETWEEGAQYCRNTTIAMENSSPIPEFFAVLECILNGFQTFEIELQIPELASTLRPQGNKIKVLKD
jgi:hypothetical protein